MDVRFGRQPGGEEAEFRAFFRTSTPQRRASPRELGPPHGPCAAVLAPAFAPKIFTSYDLMAERGRPPAPAHFGTPSGTLHNAPKPATPATARGHGGAAVAPMGATTSPESAPSAAFSFGTPTGAPSTAGAFSTNVRATSSEVSFADGSQVRAPNARSLFHRLRSLLR